MKINGIVYVDIHAAQLAKGGGKLEAGKPQTNVVGQRRVITLDPAPSAAPSEESKCAC